MYTKTVQFPSHNYTILITSERNLLFLFLTYRPMNQRPVHEWISAQVVTAYARKMLRKQQTWETLVVV